MNFKPYFFSFLVTLACGKEQEFIHSRLPNAIAVVGRSFQYFLSPQVDLLNTFKVSERGKSSLPKWLSFDLTKSQFYGVAQWRDKGEVEIEVKSLKEDKKAVFTIYVQDLHTVLNNQSSFSNETKVADFTEPNCVDGLPVAVATVLFDLNIDTLSGADRQNLMRRLSDFVNVNIKNLHMTVGRGHNTAFGFKDVTMVTAGPGNVADSKQPGIAVSWQIGCGLDVSGIEVASLLKSSSERGAFKQMLDAPVTGWHIATGHPKSHRQRVRRQINNLRPTPIVTQMPGSVIHRQIISYATQTYTMAPPTLIPGSITVTVPAPVIPTVTVNQAPIAMKSLGPMTVYLGKELRFTIPEDIIYDQEDGSVRNLRLQMKTGSGLDLSPASWILFDSAKQEIYGFPSSADVIGSHRFLLIATDSGGKSLTFPFTLEVSSARPVTFNHKVTIVLNYTKSFMDHVVVRLNLMTKIARYYGFPLDQLRVSSYKYYHGALFFTFQVDWSKVNADCDNQEFRALRDGIGNNMRLNPNLIKALLPEFQIMYGYFEGMGRCKDPSVPNTPPQVKRPIGQPVVVVWGQALHYSVPFDTFYDEHDHYTPNLMLQLRTENNQALPSTSWIQFDAARQVIYGITNDLKMVGQHSYRIVAVDSGGLEAFTSLNITVLSDRANYSHQFGIVLSHLSYTDLAGNAKIRVSLIESIAHYYGLALNRVRIAKYVHGPSVHFRFDSIPHEDCDNPELVRLIDGFWIRQKNEVNRTFVTHLKRDNFTVGTVHFNGLDSCTEVTPGIDSPPSGRRRLRLEVYLGQALNFKIPYKTFYDEQDFYTPNLNLFIRTLENREIPRWLVVDARQHILALPLNRSCVPSNEFYLVAEDSKKQEGQVDLRVKVLEDGNQYNHEFTIRLKNFVFKDNVAIKLKVLEKIAAYYGLSYKNVRVPIQGPKDAFTFRFDTVPYRDCNHRNLTKLVRGFWSGNKLNPKFLEALKPDFEIISGYYKLLEPCAPVNTPPVVVNPVATLALMQGQRGKFQIPVNTFYDKEDGYTTNLTLKASFDSNDLPSWIFFNSTKQDMISLPIDDSTVGTHKLLLTAEDSGGFAATDVVELKVTKDTTKFKNEFRFVVEDATEPVDKVQTKILMMYKVAAYFGVSLEEVHLSGFGSEYPPTLTFHLRTLGALKCDDSSLSKVIDSFMENGKLNQNFVDAMEPEFTVSTGAHKGLGLCTPPPSAPNTPPPSAPNTPPEIYNHIDRLDVFQGQGLRFHVPYDSFFDKEDGYTPNLSLQMRTIEGHELPNTSWILFNSSSQEIFGLPADVNKIGLHEILLIASDKEGGRAYDAFEVRVLEEDAPFNHKFNIILDYGNATFLRNVGVRVSLLDAIANYFGVNFTSVRVVSYAPGVLFSFYFDFVPYDECSHSFLMKLLDGFWLNGGLNPAFSSALLPGFRVISGSYERLGPCQSVIGPEVGAKVGDRPGGIWWTYAIIPAIVVAIVLLILGCCLLVMMGCCRRTKMSGADQMTYIYKKKPVVLKEEYEIKEMLLKQPLVLPNEKPPVPPVYSRSPVLGGDKTPLLNAESKSVPYQAPVFMSSRQMGGGGGGGGGGSGNAGFVANGGGPAAGAGAAGGGAAVLGGGSGAMGGLGAAAGGGGGGGGGGGAAAGAGFSAGGGGGMGSGMSAGSGGAASSGAASAAAIGNGASQGGGGGGAGGGGGGAGGGGYSVSYSMSTGGRGFKQSSFSYSYSSSSGGVSSSGRKMAYSGYRLPPAYVPP